MTKNQVIPKNVVLNERIDVAVKQLMEKYHLSPRNGYSPALRILAEKGIDALQEENQIEAKPAA